MKRILLPLLLMLLAQPLAAQKKVAILVGNGEYNDSRFRSLPTPAGDLDLMERTLRSLGYTTYPLRNATKEQLLAKMVELESVLSEADVAVFYYSGHGVSIGGDVYLVPCRTTLHASVLDEQCVSVRRVASQVGKCRLSFLFLDCCREREELAAGGYSKGALEVPPDPALGRSSRPRGQMIFYATSNGHTATTGTDRTSPFTRVLASHLADDEEFTTVAYNIREEVSRLTSGQQVPEYTGGYSSHFRFSSQPAAAQPSPAAPSQVPPCPSSDPTFKANWEKAHKGDTIAQNNLGTFYKFGLDGVKKDFAEAVKWYRKAAEQGFSAAQSNLGSMYIEGKGVEQDNTEAVKWFRLSAKQGNLFAQRQLRSMGETW